MSSQKNFNLGDKHPVYGELTMMMCIEGEPYRFFTGDDGQVSMIPLDVLEREADRG